MIISARPIEERKRAETALKESEKLYRRAIENIRDVFFRIDREGVIDMISPSGAKLPGFESIEAMIGQKKSCCGKKHKKAIFCPGIIVSLYILIAKSVAPA